jgi:hypothetical protein
VFFFFSSAVGLSAANDILMAALGKNTAVNNNVKDGHCKMQND